MRVRELKLLKEGIYKLYIRTHIHLTHFNANLTLYKPKPLPYGQTMNNQNGEMK